MEAKHTPGPWTVQRYGRGFDVLREGRIIADCKAQSGADLPSCEANARLIAAAPALLEALRDAVASLEWCAEQFESMALGNDSAEARVAASRMRDAIAQAEGGGE